MSANSTQPQRPDYFKRPNNVTCVPANEGIEIEALAWAGVEIAFRMYKLTGQDVAIRFVHDGIIVPVTRSSQPAAIAAAWHKAKREGEKRIGIHQPESTDIPCRPESADGALVFKEFYFRVPDDADVTEVIRQAVFALNYRYHLCGINLLTFRVRNFRITVTFETNPDTLVEDWEHNYSTRTNFVHIGSGPDVRR